jgi:two-component system, cell cycle sensor histidine kinase and response regulator CckA
MAQETVDSKKDLRLLIIEDSEMDAELMVLELKRSGYTVTWQYVDNAEALQGALKEQQWDIIISDYALPQFNGLEALEIVKSHNSYLPFILVSGTIGEEFAVEAMRAGADDYLLKDRLARLGLAVERELQEAKERIKLIQIEEELKKSDAYYRSIFNNSLHGIAITGIDLKFLKVNSAFCRLLEYSEEELIGKLGVADITHPEDIDRSKELIIQLLRREIAYFVLEKRYITKSGRTIVAISFVNTIYDEAGHYMATVVSIMDITENKRAEEQLRLAEFSIEHSGLSTIWFDRNSRVVRVNEAACQSLGYDRQELMQMTVRDFDPDFQSVEKWNEVWEIIRSKPDYSVTETHHRRKDGTIFPVEVLSSFCKYVGQEYIFSFIRNTTELKQAEEEKERLQAQFLHSQKMEAVGRLAGGVAHDFNNMLSVIIGYSELAKNELSPNDPLYLKVEQILKAANKSADLTRQLLAFSRQQIVELKILDLNKIIADSENMLRRLIGEDIDLKFIPQFDLWPVRMDRSQIDQILVNLAVNARDAIADTGKLIIETGNVGLDEAYCARRIGVLPGNYIVLTISDNGSGMDKKTLDRLFEPFFTTKGEGKGTGLGLSTIFGIVKQNNGFIDVFSELGIGTTFKIYFPRYQGQDVQEEEREAPLVLRGSETVLVVEDEEQILAICRDLLDKYGYRVLTARQAGEAIILCEKYHGNIHLLITDVVMPIMNGKELKERVEQMKPDIQVLYMSGYTTDIMAHRGILADGVNFIQKPFTVNDFLRKVRETLERK